jgi:hypothetical protein
VIAIPGQWPGLDRLAPWATSVGLGAILGVSIITAHRYGAPGGLEAAVLELPARLNRLIGPVWVVMLVVALRVAWLGIRAYRTRLGQGATGQPVRPELGQLAPIFAALGLCGTVWGLTAAFDALQEGEFLERLPALLGGLGAAMTSTLVGLGLQIGTLLLGAFNPAWSVARVEGPVERLAFWLDGAHLGCCQIGLDGLIEALGARQPEALRLEFSGEVGPATRAEIRRALWKQTDSVIPIREINA